MRVCLVVFVAVCAVHPVFGQHQEEVLTVGMTTLRIGMTQHRVVTELRKSFDVTERYANDTASTWSVIRKGGSLADQVGEVRFQNKRLVSAFKEWGPLNQQQGVEFATALYGALAALAETRKPCVIGKVENLQPDYTLRRMAIACGNKMVDFIILGRHGETDSATIVENLGNIQ